MKRLLIFCFLISIQTTFAQRVNVDSLISKIAAEKDEDKKLALTMPFYTPEINNDPTYSIDIGMKMLKQSQLDKNIAEESTAYSFLGHGYRFLGNTVKSLEYHHKALQLAERDGNPTLLGIAKNQLAHIYKDRGDYDKAIQIYLSSAADADRGKNEISKTWPLINLGAVYLAANKLDSSLVYSQRIYEKNLTLKDVNLTYLASLNLAGVHSKLGNAALAISYYNMALNSPGSSTTRYRNNVYVGLAEHYKNAQQTDSCKQYALKAIEVVRNTPFFYLSSKPAQMLADIYQKNNCDSSLKYASLYKTATDSLNTSKTNQQVLLMTFDEDLRQQEVAAEKIKEHDERKQNIQYALIALGIIVLVSLYLLLSRSFITSSRLIEFFGVIALLIVFEFLNLLLHPFLEKITHHNPILMLLALVCIAALLVPLHHKTEHWATKKLVEKNKQMRLAAAKKTIATLENDKQDHS